MAEAPLGDASTVELLAVEDVTIVVAPEIEPTVNDSEVMTDEPIVGSSASPYPGMCLDVLNPQPRGATISPRREADQPGARGSDPHQVEQRLATLLVAVRCVISAGIWQSA